MPRIFDNISDESRLITTLRKTLELSYKADFCVGYFNLRGWRLIDALIDKWPGGDGACCRLLVGMQRLPQDEMQARLSLTPEESIDHSQARRLTQRMAQEFRTQLAFSAPTNADEAGLRRLSKQLRARKVVVKLYLRHPLHAKLYMLHRHDPNNPVTGFLGSSNLTMSGLSYQGELNVDVLEHDACRKLEGWFNDRWCDNFCLDISDELADIIDSSWAREAEIPPYHIYLKMAYHLSQEARAGLAEFEIPKEFRHKLFDFQTAAVKIAAHHVNKRGGVLMGDVVGLGKTFMATALARVFEDDFGVSTLIICPKNLVRMWQSYVDQYGLRARILPISKAIKELPHIPARFRLVVIDESHNLRNREGKTYRAIQEYIAQSDSKCILLSATPYNKEYNDLSSQLRLFVPEDQDIGVRPEKYLAEIGEIAFQKKHQCAVRSIAAFEHSPYADDWRDLMRLYMVRRTRSFIRDNYAVTEEKTGRRYLVLDDGSRSFFPTRVPKKVEYSIGDYDDPYARLYSDPVVDAINRLSLPRYGLANYIAKQPPIKPTADEQKQLQGLGRAGKRLMGFSRTNLFKRLESGGPAYLQSIDRHILRNYIVLHAIENDKPLPLGTQNAALLDSATFDDDVDAAIPLPFDEEETSEQQEDADGETQIGPRETDYRERAAAAYALYATKFKSRFKWLRPGLFNGELLATHLAADAQHLTEALRICGMWDAHKDAKLAALVNLLMRTHPREKVLVFTQFADTAHYLKSELAARGVDAVESVTGSSSDPTGLAWRFSPESNDRSVKPEDQVRVLVTTDVLSEGQNLQDCHIVVNYDLPWAIIRLIQRAGRVDRIGQKAEGIVVYTFLPTEGVEKIIGLRRRVMRRLKENAEVIGTDEVFFEDQGDEQPIIDLYNEKAGILDGEDDSEVDLASYAYQIWKNATDRDHTLLATIPALPPVAYSTRPHSATKAAPEGVLVYMRTQDGSDALAWVNEIGKSVTQSQLTILQQARCVPDTLALPRSPLHHDLVAQGIAHIVEEERSVGGQLGKPTSPRYRAYQRLKRYADAQQGTLFENLELPKAIDLIYHHPLQEAAADVLRRQLKSGIDDYELADLVLALHEDKRLCIVHDDERRQEAQIICSLGLFAPRA